ncbi:hypothetical protein [Streptomyces sp. UNOB3_S3]|uniref:hypothetical protein n=1 Tax=Streptomyces sp. UNOB3_S3 TaxID=2871682 RepID=UPI001E5833EF|nr:hypothetical protein [Streptomyces sp. UNOB3_S3]
MKRIKAAVVMAAVVAGLAVSAAPAQARQCQGEGGAVYICEYGVTGHALPGGEKEQFLVASDQAVWTRWTSGGRWGGWVSLGGVVKSGVKVDDTRTRDGGLATFLLVTGTDGQDWMKVRERLGQGWSDWFHPDRA